MQKVGENLIKLKNDIIKLTKLDSNIQQENYNYITAINNIIDLLFENSSLKKGYYEELLQKDDIEYVRKIFSDECLTFKEQNSYIKNHDMKCYNDRHILIKRCLWVPTILSLKYINNGIEYIDLLQQGYFGIENAINKYRKNNTKAFSSLVKKEVVISLEKYIREYGKYGHISNKKFEIFNVIDYIKEYILKHKGHEASIEEIAEYLGYPLDYVRELLVLSDGSLNIDSIDNELDENRIGFKVVDAEEVAINNIYYEDLIEVCNLALSGREKFIVYHTYGLNNCKLMSINEITSYFGCSGTNIYYILDKSLIKIRNKYKEIQNRRIGLLNINDVKELRKKGITF